MRRARRTGGAALAGLIVLLGAALPSGGGAAVGSAPTVPANVAGVNGVTARVDTAPPGIARPDDPGPAVSAFDSAPVRFAPDAGDLFHFPRFTVGDQRQEAPVQAPFPAPLVSFEAISSASRSVNPDDNIHTGSVPDTNGDVGPNHYVQSTNHLWAVYNKSGQLLGGPYSENTFWRNAAQAEHQLCKNNARGDPIILYDPLADRWISTFFAFAPSGAPHHECIAVSTSPNPLGTWCYYSFNVNADVDSIYPGQYTGHFPDYPKFGVWPDAYYMTANLFSNDDAVTQRHALAIAFERSKLLACQAQADVKRIVWVNPTNNSWRTLPADLDGPAPPAGAPGLFLAPDHLDDPGQAPGRFLLYRLSVNWQTFTASISAPQAIAVGTYGAFICNDGRCISQPGTDVKLDPSHQGRLMQRLAYRNFGTHESLVVNQTVNAGGNAAGVRWYEIRDPRGTPVLYQQGTLSSTSEHRWVGSAAMDKFGNLAVGYSVSGSGTYPSLRYAGRLAADPLGTLPLTERTLVAGSGSKTQYNGGLARWGDYSAMSVDPSDDCTFWFTGEYLKTNVDAVGWHTRVGSFRLPLCGPLPPDVDTTPPTAPTGLGRTAFSQTSITVAWGGSSDDRGTTGYGLYLNGAPIGATGATSHTFGGLNCGTNYTIQVDATDAAGNRSPRATLATGTDRCQVVVRVALQGPRARFQRERTFQVSWGAVRSGARYDVQYRGAKFRGIYGRWISWKANTPVTSTSFTGRGGTSYCFRVRTNAQSGFVSDWANPRCTALPVSVLERTMRGRGGWRYYRGRGRFLNAFALSVRRGASLGLTGVRATRLALVVTKCPRCGSVNVYWNKRLLASARLTAASLLYKQVIEVGTFPAQQKGSIRIVVTSRGKPVAIEGLGVFS